MMRTPFFVLASALASMMLLRRVGQRRMQRDEIGARQQLVELDLLDAQRRPRVRATGTGRRPRTFILRPEARSATIEPTLPQPMTPSVLPVSSTPMKRDFSHLPAWVERSAAGNWRASANIIAMACSAVVIELPKGVFMTTMPRWVAAGTSILSTPMPARPITLSFLARVQHRLRHLGGGAHREPVEIADDLLELVGRQARS